MSGLTRQRTTLSVLAFLLDGRAMVEGARVRGHLHPDAPAASPDQAREIRDRTRRTMEKLLTNKALTDEEMTAARDALAWWRERPGTEALPYNQLEALLDALVVPDGTPENKEIVSIEKAILMRWWREDPDGNRSETDEGSAGTNGGAPTPPGPRQASKGLPLEEMLARARDRFSYVEHWLRHDDLAGALHILGGLENELDELREALLAELASRAPGDGGIEGGEIE